MARTNSHQGITARHVPIGAQWVGLPFFNGGRTRVTGLDCWGLVRLYLQEACGVKNVPVYGEAPASDVAATTAAVGEAMHNPMWRRLETGEPLHKGDVAVMYGWEQQRGGLQKTLRHVGVLTDAKTVLHIEVMTDSVRVPLSSTIIRRRVHSLWRHKELDR